MIQTVSSSCVSPMATWLSVKNAGSGQPHIMCPIEKYMSMSKRTTETISRRLSAGVSRSRSASAESAAICFSAAAVFFDAP